MSFTTQAGLDFSMIYLTPEQSESETIGKTIMENSCDVTVLHVKNIPFIKHMQKASIPVILVGDNMEEDNVYYVVPMEAGALSMEAERLTTMKFFSQKRDITAIIGMADEMVYGILRALYDLGIKVPEDISLTGFDDYKM
ncbi:MAG: LacI family transcriptional regulator [Lentisphaerae bacterium]|nr:LacI family transcriptional regulator [Lentisphaerota bacterium]MCP4100233.1 LacI family transcriptional regulator [Lentisphaerota bacterium]